jgi:hypothetical protein
MFDDVLIGIAITSTLDNHRMPLFSGMDSMSTSNRWRRLRDNLVAMRCGLLIPIVPLLATVVYFLAYWVMLQGPSQGVFYDFETGTVHTVSVPMYRLNN